MKLLSIKSFNMPVESNAGVEITLPQNKGLFFRIQGGTFTSLLFGRSQGNVPIVLEHSDRSNTNIKIVADENKVTVTQGYQQENVIQLFTIANDDYVEEDQLAPNYIDALTIRKVILNNGTEVNVNASLYNERVQLLSTGYTPSSGSVPALSVITSDNSEYIFPVNFNSHQTSTEPSYYDYMSVIVNRVLEVYHK